MNQNLETRRKRIETLVKVLGLGVAGFIVAPFVFVAIKGLVGLVVAAILGWLTIQFTPVVAAMVANWRLKAIKAEAARNPVETLQNDFMKRQEALGQFRQAILNFSAEIQNFKDKLASFIDKYPAEANKFKEQLETMKRLLKLRQGKYQQAQDNLEAYRLEIQKAGAIWEMGQAAAAMNQAAGMSEEDFLAKIQVETALDSVQKSLNLAFADLETSLLDEEKKPQVVEKNLVQSGMEQSEKPAQPRQRIAEV